MQAAHRNAFFERMAPNSVAVFHSGRPKIRNHDVTFRFRPESDFYYLCGFNESDASLVLQRSDEQRRTLLFRAPPTAHSERWTGRRGGMAETKQDLGLDEMIDSAEFGRRLTELLRGAETLYHTFGKDHVQDRLILEAVGHARAATRDRGSLPGMIIYTDTILGEARLIKDPDELALMRRAAVMTVEAHKAAMAACRPGLFEYEIEALVDTTFRRLGGEGPAYPTIVGGGANATVLHYTANNARLRQGDLVLIDAGAEFSGYASDITRTFPVSGRFSAAQRRIYDIVLRAQEAAIATVRPGVTFDAPHRSARRVLTEGLVRIGILEGDAGELLEKGALDGFYMHRTSHWLGLDVHDAGAWRLASGIRRLEPGMVLTIEPGLYFPHSETLIPEAYRGLGIRIEDDLLVTPGGHEILTAAMPKSPEEIERLCATT